MKICFCLSAQLSVHPFVTFNGIDLGIELLIHFIMYLFQTLHTYGAGLEKLTNANRSVSTVNERLPPVELTEIADWKSMSEYI